jgi:hypothetical protein
VVRLVRLVRLETQVLLAQRAMLVVLARLEILETRHQVLTQVHIMLITVSVLDI